MSFKKGGGRLKDALETWKALSEQEISVFTLRGQVIV